MSDDGDGSKRPVGRYRSYDGPPGLPVDESQTRLAKTGGIDFSRYCNSPSEAKTVPKGRFGARTKTSIAWRACGFYCSHRKTLGLAVAWR